MKVLWRKWLISTMAYIKPTFGNGGVAAEAMANDAAN